MNSFACELCKQIRDFAAEEFVPIEDAVAKIREEVPSLIALLRERVNLMSNTRADLEKLLGKLNQEKVYIIKCVMLVIFDSIFLWCAKTETISGKGYYRVQSD